MPSTSDYGDFVAGKLAARLASGTTSGATVTAQSVNGSTITWPTGAHRLKLVRKTRTGTEVETVGVASASQSGSTVTLGTLTRQLSLTDGSTFSSGGNGRTLPANTDVYLTWDVFDAERAMKDDKVNTLTGAGAIRSTSTSTPIIRLNSVTTAQRNAMTAANGDMVYDSDLGVNFQYIGGAWVAVGDTGTENASDTVAGKVERATSAQANAGTDTGDTGAPTFVRPSQVTTVSNLASTANGKGASLVGVEDSAANFSGTTVETVLAELQGNIDSALTLDPVSSLQVGTSTSSPAFASTTAEIAFSPTYSITGNSLVAGDVLEVFASGNWLNDSGTYTLRLKAGATTLFSLNSASGGSTNHPYILRATIVVRSTAAVLVTATIQYDTTTVAYTINSSTTALDLTNTQVLQLTGQFDTSRAPAVANLYTFNLTKIASPA